MADYHPFNPNPRRPSETPPRGACDFQFHVFGSTDKYPVRPGSAYEMPSATIERALHMHRTLGIDRGLIVQATTYGSDHQAVLDALAIAGPDYRGCANAVVFRERDDAYIEKLHRAGFRGARFTFRKMLGLMPSNEQFEREVARLRELGWFAKIHPDPEGIVECASVIESVDVPVVIDHFGRPDASRGTDDPNVRKVLELLKKGNFWVMLSLGEKVSKKGRPWDDVIPIARAYIEAAPDRCLWASDWPHPLSKSPPPNEADLLELLYRFAPDESERRRILVDNPAQLLAFDR